MWFSVTLVRPFSAALSAAMNLKNYNKWWNAIESETKYTTRVIDVAVNLRSLLNIAKTVTSTRWALKVKPHRRFEARRQVVLG